MCGVSWEMESPNLNCDAAAAAATAEEMEEQEAAAARLLFIACDKDKDGYITR